MAEYQRGQGPDALPQGAATALNTFTPEQGALALENQEIPVQYASGEGDQDEPTTGGSDELAILTQPPDPNRVAPLIPKERPGRVPRYVVRHLPQLLAAVRDPAAPPTLIAIKNSIIRHLEAEQRQGR